MEDKPTLYRRGVCTCAIGHTRYSATRHCLEQTATARQAGNVDVETSGNTPTERPADITPVSHWAGHCFSVSLRKSSFSSPLLLFLHALKAKPCDIASVRSSSQTLLDSLLTHPSAPPAPRSCSGGSSLYRSTAYLVRVTSWFLSAPPGLKIRPRPFPFKSFLIHLQGSSYRSTVHSLAIDSVI
jgi:hypothetical protein